MATKTKVITEKACFRAYVYFWSLHRLYETNGGTNQTLGWDVFEQVAVATLAALASLTTAPFDLATAMVVLLCLDFRKLPYIWDSEFWCAMTDLSLLWQVFGKRKRSGEELFADFAASATKQMVLCYAAASFWKWNWDFFDTRASCAPIFAMQTLDFLGLDAFLPSSALRFVGAVSPAAVVLLEAAIAALLWLTPKAGVKLALVLHTFIAFTAPPNNVATFSLTCASKLVLFVPRGFATVLLKSGGWTLLEKAVWAASVAFAAQVARHEAFYDLGLPLFVFVAFPVWRAATLHEEEEEEEEADSKKKKTIGWGHPLVLLAFFYNFGLLALGLQDQGAPHMYANLRLHGGSNHFLMPTGLLQRWRGEDASSAFYGGVVRIERSTSTGLNEIYPSDYSLQLSNATRRMLAEAGHTARMFNPMLTAVTSSEAPWSPGTVFVKYTMPAHEFRRVLPLLHHDDDDDGEKFLVEYTQLPEASGDETWRATAKGRTVRYEHLGKNRTKCTVIAPRAERGPCGPSDLPLLPPLPFWATKVLMFEPYPILPDDYRLHCFGP